MKILFLFKSLDGGTATYMKSLLKLREIRTVEKIRIKVIALEKPGYRVINNLNYHVLHRKGTLPEKYLLTLGSVITFLKELVWFNSVVVKYNPDVVMSNDTHAIVISQLIKLLFDKKYKHLAIIHNYLPEVFRLRLPLYLHYPFKTIYSFLLRRSNYVVTYSKELSKNVAKYMNLKTLPLSVYGALSDESVEMRRNHGKSTRFVITSIGRLAPQKDFSTLLKAFALASKEIPVILEIAGDGPDKHKLQRLSVSLGIEDKVRFLGWVQNTKEVLRKSDLFILSSHWEGFGFVIIEALSVGVPVIATDCPYGPGEILENNKYGVLVKKENIKSLANAILDLYKDDDKRKHYSLVGPLRAKYFSERKFLNAYKELLFH